MFIMVILEMSYISAAPTRLAKQAEQHRGLCQLTPTLQCSYWIIAHMVTTSS